MSAEVAVFVSSKVLLSGADEPAPATIEVNVHTGKISAIHNEIRTKTAYPNVKAEHWHEAGDAWIIPGLVDAHVHLNEPGRTDWEGFWTGTLAAATGGVTTVVDMPLNSIPPTTTPENLLTKMQAANGQCLVDVAFWGGVIPGNEKHLKPLIDAGVKGFKCFLIESGVDEFPCVSEEDVKTAMQELQGQPTVLAFHAELDKQSTASVQDQDPTSYTTFLHSRPPKLETDAIDLIISLARHHPAPNLRCHIVHLSAASALPALRAAKSAGVNMTVETCFHYLALSASDIPAGRAEFKCCPPIREEGNREKLWEALVDGTIDCVVSDHSPCVAELKRVDGEGGGDGDGDGDGDLMKAWGGISTLGLGLSILWTEARKRGIGIRRVLEWTSLNTAKHASLDGRKGAIKVGMDADFAFWDPDATFKVTKDSLAFKNKLSAYEGLVLQGRVSKTYVRGLFAWGLEEGENQRFGTFL